MKKRFCCIATMLLVTLALAACGGGGTSQVDSKAKSAFEKAKETAKAITDAQIKLTTESVIKGADAEHITTIKTESVIKEANGTEKGMDMDIRYKQSINEKEETVTVHIKDGKAYVDNGKEKLVLDSPAMYSGLGTLAQNLILGLDDEALKGLTKEEKDDQNVYQITIDGEKFAGYFQKAQGGGEEQDQNKDQKESPKSAKDVEMQVVTDKSNLIKSVRMSCVYTFFGGDGEESMEDSYKLRAEFVSVNTGLTIQFPDLSKYKKAGASGGEE